jgi:hypothetical protein
VQLVERLRERRAGARRGDPRLPFSIRMALPGGREAVWDNEKDYRLAPARTQHAGSIPNAPFATFECLELNPQPPKTCSPLLLRVYSCCSPRHERRESQSWRLKAAQ